LAFRLRVMAVEYDSFGETVLTGVLESGHIGCGDPICVPTASETSFRSVVASMEGPGPDLPPIRAEKIGNATLIVGVGGTPRNRDIVVPCVAEGGCEGRPNVVRKPSALEFDERHRPPVRRLSISEAIAFELHHSVYRQGVSTPRLLAAAAEDGRISLCSFTAEPNISRLSAPGMIAAVSPHPSRPLLAVATKLWTQGHPSSAHGDPGKLYVLGFDGSPIFEEAAPRPPKGWPEWRTGGYTDCQFDESGAYLLCAANVSDHFEIQLRETNRWSVVSRVVVADPHICSLASFRSTARPDTWALWLDGLCAYWAIRDGDSLRAMIEPCLEDKEPPEFSPSGDEFLTMDRLGIQLQRYRGFGRRPTSPWYRLRWAITRKPPPAELLGVCESPYGDDLFAADSFGRSLCYLDNSWALARSTNGRIAVVDTRSMRAVDEIAIEGHEPRPTEEYYPRLVGDRALCTDISEIARVGDYLIVRHSRPLEPGLEARRDGILCFPINYVLDRHTA
jgi:hypothetical protein